ncbi:MAG: YgfZ/GcvT domain-containing protein [Candidatus Nanopelagicales bacterium]
MSQVAVSPPQEWLDQDIPWHFGNPLAEQKLLANGDGVVELSNRVVISLTGPERLTWLDSISSHQVANLIPSQSASTLILSPHGHVEHELHVIAGEEVCYLIAEADTADALLGDLQRMKFMAQVEINLASDLAVVFEPIREISDLPTWLTPLEFGELGLTAAGSSAGGDQSRYLLPRPAKFVGREVLVPKAELANYLSGKQLAGSWSYNALRIAAGVPRIKDLDHKTLPHEIGLIGPAVHLSKGCYRGQETVARLHNLGKPPRRLTLLYLEAGDDELPAHGDLVKVADQEVGVICSAAQHFELGPIALALIKRSVAESETVSVSGKNATQHSIINSESNRG